MTHNGQILVNMEDHGRRTQMDWFHLTSHKTSRLIFRTIVWEDHHPLLQLSWTTTVKTCMLRWVTSPWHPVCCRHFIPNLAYNINLMEIQNHMQLLRLQCKIRMQDYWYVSMINYRVYLITIYDSIKVINLQLFLNCNSSFSERQPVYVVASRR